MSKTQEWSEIMAQLRGTKLHVYDDILQGVQPVESALRIQEALGWLVYNRFVWKDGDRYAARTFAEARALWLADGAARIEAANVARPVTAPPEEQPGEPAAATVHAKRPMQPELFP